MRVAHVLRPAAGGMLTHVNDLLANPASHGLVVAPASVLGAIQAKTDARMTAAASGNPVHQIRDAIQVARFARAHQSEILHLHGISRLPLASIAARIARLPWTVTLHNMVGFPPRHPGRFALAGFLKRADALIAVSDAVRNSVPNVGREIDVIYNGIDRERFTDLPERTEARRLLEWDKQTPIVLAVSRLSPEKGIDLLVPLAKTPGLRVVVAGDGPLRHQLANSGLECIGPRDDAPLLMAAADIVVVPSRSEGLGLTAIEAAAAGRPVVATRTGGLPEVVEDGQTGLLVEPGNPNDIVDAVQTLLANVQLRAEMGRTAQSRAQTRFSRQTMWEATDRVYQRILRP